MSRLPDPKTWPTAIDWIERAMTWQEHGVAIINGPHILKRVALRTAGDVPLEILRLPLTVAFDMTSGPVEAVVPPKRVAQYRLERICAFQFVGFVYVHIEG